MKRTTAIHFSLEFTSFRRSSIEFTLFCSIEDAIKADCLCMTLNADSTNAQKLIFSLPFSSANLSSIFDIFLMVVEIA